MVDINNLTPESITQMSEEELLNTIRSLRMARRAPKESKTTSLPKEEGEETEKKTRTRTKKAPAVDVSALSQEDQVKLLLSLLSGNK